MASNRLESCKVRDYVSFVFSTPVSSRNKTIMILNALSFLNSMYVSFSFQLVLLDYDVNSNNNLDSSNSPYLLIAPPIHVGF